MKKTLLLTSLFSLSTSTYSVAMYGGLGNFDAVNDTGVEVHGFEIELDDVTSTQIGGTYDLANEKLRTAGAAEGISGRVIFAACWAGMPKKTFAKVAPPRTQSRDYSVKSAATVGDVILKRCDSRA